MAGVQIDGVNNKIDFDDDLDTSISANVDDTLQVEVGGASVATLTASTIVFNEASADIDFRVESNGNANMLFVDGGENHVGIGTNAPKELLHIEDAAPILRISDSNSTSEDDAVSKIQFFDRNNTDVCSEIISGTGSLADLIISNNNSRAILFFTVAGNERFRISSSGDISTGGENAADAQVTLDQNAGDAKLLSFKSSDIAHGITDNCETDTYGFLQKNSATEGCLMVTGIGESRTGLMLDGYHIDADTATNTNASGPVRTRAWIKSGTSIADSSAADQNVFTVSAGGAAKFLVKGDGDIFYDGADQGAFDSYDDAMLVRSLDLSHNKNVINSTFDKYIKYNHETLAQANLVGRENDGTPNHFINVSGMQRLHNGAIWQQYEKHQKLAEAVYEMAKETLGADKADAILKKHDIKLLN